MKGKASLLVAGGFCVVLMVGGCGDSDSGTPTIVPTQTVTHTATLTPTATTTATPTGTPIPTLTTCATDTLLAPRLEDPPMWAVVDSLTPSLRWSYGDPSCNPEGYRIYLSTGPLFADDLSGGTGNPSTSWGPAAPLQPGTEYAWAVQAINGTALGPIAGTGYFFTGPSCEPTSLKAPDLLAPANNAVITDTLATSLIWDYPDPCLADGYLVDLSTSPAFDGSPLNGGTANPSTRWGPGVPLTDCTRYYWRVAAHTGVQLGQYSEVHTFRVAVSLSCPAETP
jgi:hypothetical protein